MRFRGWLTSMLLFGLAITLRPGAACWAQGGINLSWNDCGPAGNASRTFACTTNAPVIGNLFASVIPPVDVAQLNGSISVIDVETNQASLSPWWHVEPGGCRGSALTAAFDFTNGPFYCADAWAGEATGGLGFQAAYPGPNRMRIVAQCSIPGTREMPVQTEEFGYGTEYYVFKLILGGQKSTGEGSCAGCGNGACLFLQSITLTQPAGAQSFPITAPILRQYVTFQPGGSAICPRIEDPFPTRTRTRTWGAVKSLYR